MSELKGLREQYGQVYTQWRELADEQVKSAKEGTDFADDKRKKLEGFETEMDQIETAIKTAEKAESMDKNLQEKVAERAEENQKSTDEQQDKEKSYSKAFGKFLRVGLGGLNQEERQIMAEKRTQTTQTGSSGGHLIPTEQGDTLWEALKHVDGLRSAGATVITTSDGAPIDYPLMDDTGNDGEWLSENSASTNTALAYTEKSIEAWTASSDHLLVPIQLVQDADYDLEGHINRALGLRLGRLTNAGYTTGDGSSKPHGIDGDANSGVTAASATAVTADEIHDLQYALNSAYQQNAGWMMAQSTLKAIRKLKDSDNQYLWQPGLQAGEPGALLGKPVTVNDDVAAIAASADAIFYGDFSHYLIRDAIGIQMTVLTERYMDKLQYGYIAYLRTDGRLMDANSTTYNPVQMLTMASS